MLLYCVNAIMKIEGLSVDLVFSMNSNFSKFLSVVITTCSVLCNCESNDSVKFCVGFDRSFVIKIDGIKKEFKNTDIKEMNAFTSKYFTFDYTTNDVSQNKLILHNFASNSNINNNYSLVFSVYNDCFSNIVLDYHNNELNIPKIWTKEGVTSVIINSDLFNRPNACELYHSDALKIYFKGRLLIDYDNVNVIFNKDAFMRFLRETASNVHLLMRLMMLDVKDKVNDILNSILPHSETHRT